MFVYLPEILASVPWTICYGFIFILTSLISSKDKYLPDLLYVSLLTHRRSPPSLRDRRIYNSDSISSARLKPIAFTISCNYYNRPWLCDLRSMNFHWNSRIWWGLCVLDGQETLPLSKTLKDQSRLKQVLDNALIDKILIVYCLV